MPKQIKHLLILFLAILAVAAVTRELLVPETFGDYGHYRAVSLDVNKAKPIQYAGKESCTECHEEYADMIFMDVHESLSCESCHGPAQAHVENPEVLNMNMRGDREFCGLCHAIHPARDRNVIFQIDLSEHYVEKDCIECHNPHMPWDLKE